MVLLPRSTYSPDIKGYKHRNWVDQPTTFMFLFTHKKKKKIKSDIHIHLNIWQDI